jgi:hypothetical protein
MTIWQPVTVRYVIQKSANITNFVSNVARRVDYNIGIWYSDDADKAITLENLRSETLSFERDYADCHKHRP